jgi:hypothetical protein
MQLVMIANTFTQLPVPAVYLFSNGAESKSTFAEHLLGCRLAGGQAVFLKCVIHSSLENGCDSNDDDS